MKQYILRKTTLQTCLRFFEIMNFFNKVILVTGASSGIGAATAIKFAKQGANVAIVGRKENKLKSVAEECNRSGNKTLQIVADVSNDDDAKRIIDNTIAEFGKLDALVNNAGIAGFGRVLGGKIMDSYDKVTNVNVRAAVYITSLAASHLTQTKGCIVNVSSVAAVAPPIQSAIAYSMSKAALNSFTAGAALELSSLGVRVNGISPGPVVTDIMENAGMKASWEEISKQTALKRASDPEEIADLVMYLCSEKAKGITGSNFITDNGYLLKP